MRNHVRIVQIRAVDAQAGDVVNRRGAERAGWIEVDQVESLPDGNLVIHDRSQHDDFTANLTDLLWLQVLVPFKTRPQS